MAKKKKDRQKKQESSSDNACLDGCYYVSFDGWFLDDGCLNTGDGCFDFEFDGCFDFGDGCTLVMAFPFRIMVIIGLMLYGDWDFKNKRAKE